LRAGEGALTLEEVEAAAAVVADVGGTASSDANLGGSTLSVVGLLGWVATRLNSPDTPDSGVRGSEAILDLVA
jgi:hypothetical protein